MKIQISIDDELLKKVDAFAKKNYMSRSAVLAQGAFALIQSREISQALPEVLERLNDLSRDNDLDDDTKREVSDLQAAARLIKNSVIGQVKTDG